jgi:hypothetical protein
MLDKYVVAANIVMAGTLRAGCFGHSTSALDGAADLVLFV